MNNVIFIANKYILLEEIGKGTFGIIHRGINKRTNGQVAIKVEPLCEKIKLLKNECKIYQYLTGIYGVPSVRWFGKDNINTYMIIDLLGDSLYNIKKQHGIFSLSLTLKIGIHILTILKHIHEKGLIHRDIKPDNFLMGLHGATNKIYIIDFGLCKSYLNENNEHIKEKYTNNLIGTPTYASINAHKHLELSRRDDLESLGYLLLFLCLKDLPWRETNMDLDTIVSLKEYILQPVYKNNINLPKQIIMFITTVRKLSFNQIPDYECLMKLLSA